MYICAECASHFEQPRIVHETHGFTDGSTEEFDVCPCCDGDRIDRAEKCQCCGGYHSFFEMTEGLCDGCRAIWRDGFFAALRERFTAKELYYISVSMDGFAIDYKDPDGLEHYSYLVAAS